MPLVTGKHKTQHKVFISFVNAHKLYKGRDEALLCQSVTSRIQDTRNSREKVGMIVKNI